ncbi:MAG: hypothetical protein JY451_15285 [Erythrobacter sp.]|nr:MAG: hypothetical protein JY451_15285 [Erythrobacter sp.]
MTDHPAPPPDPHQPPHKSQYRPPDKPPRKPGLATTLPAFAPVPRLKQRHDGWTPRRQQQFIEALADTGSVKSAARTVGLTPEGAYLLRRHPQAVEFRAAWEAALDLGVQRIEDVAMDRALNGVEQPVFAYGQVIGTRREYNDQLLMFMLRNRAPKRFATGGGARGLSGSDQFKLKRLKKEWRREWQAERDAEEESDEAVVTSLTAKLDKARMGWLYQLSPRTRAAYDEYQRMEVEDTEQGYQFWKDPEHPFNTDPRDGDGGEDGGKDCSEDGSSGEIYPDWNDYVAAEAERTDCSAPPTPEMRLLLPGAKARAEPDDGWDLVRDENGIARADGGAVGKEDER